LVIFTILTMDAMAQLDKGSWMVGGNMGFQSANSRSTFYINPNIGYFFANKLAAGMAFSYYNASTSLVSVGPFMRAYVKINAVSLFLHSRFVYTNTTTGSIKNDQFGFGGGHGVGVFLNEYVALEGLLDYCIPDLGDSKNSSLGFNIGLQIYFPKK